MSLEQDIANYLAQSEERKTSIGKRPNSIQSNTNLIQETQPGTLLGNVGESIDSEGDSNMAQEIFGNLAWNWVDEALIGTLGMAEEYDWLERGADYFLDTDASGLQESLTTLRDLAVGDKTFISPDTGEKYRAGPQTFYGKAAGAVGTVGGFITGGPMAVVKGVKAGVGGLTRIATGTKSTAGILKEGSKAAHTIANTMGDDITGHVLSKDLRSGIGRATALSSKPGGLNKNVNYVEYIQAGITSTVDDYVANGLITKKLGDEIGGAYMKYIKDRPINTFTDYMLSNSTNPRLAYTVGSMVEEALMFGTLDGIREGIHVLGSGGEHKYDWTHPMWGAIMGTGFGALKFLSPRGKGSLGKNDFKSAIKGQLARSSQILKKQSYPTLKQSATMLGADAEALGLHVVDDVMVAGQKFSFNLTNVESEVIRILDAVGAKIDDVAKASLLREVLAKEANVYGSQLLKWATKNSWASIQENWPRMVGGATMMNARSIYDMTQGHNVGWDDIAINVMLGAWLNRKGAPRKMDMFPEQVQRLRSGLHTLDILPKSYLNTNPITRIPTLDFATSSNMNPFASDRGLNNIVKLAESLGLTTDNFDSIDSSVSRSRKGDALTVDLVGGSIKSATQSSKDLRMFNVLYRFLQGASSKKYVRSLDNIAEADALKIQDALIKNYGNEAGMKKHLRAVAENIGTKFEKELVGSTIDILKVLGIKTGNINDGNIGKIPDIIVFDDIFLKHAKDGKLSSLIESFEGVKNEPALLDLLNKKLNIMLQGTLALDKASLRQTDKAIIIRDLAQLDALMRLVNTRELSINTELGLSNTSSNRFTFDKMGDMMYYMKSRIVGQKVGLFSEMLDKNFKDKADVLLQLIDSGLVKSNDLKTDLRLVEGIDQITITEGGKPLKHSGLVHEGKMLLSSILEVLGAKGQYNTTSEPVRIDISQINKLKSFLNSKGLNTEAMSLANFATEAVRRITYENFKSSNLNDTDIAIFQSLYHLGSPDLINKFSLMKYGRPGTSKKAVNIIASKLNYEGTDSISLDIVKKYNEMVDLMIERGKVEGKTEAFVVEGDTYTITNDNTLRTVQSVVQDAMATADRTARHSLTDFLMTTIGKNNTRDAALTFMSAYPEHTTKLTKLLINTGALELKPGEGKAKGTYEYSLNQSKWSDSAIQQKIIELTSRYGVNMDTVDTMTNRANKDLETYLDGMYSSGDHAGSITPNKFFESYLPSKSRNPSYINEYIDTKLYNERGEFKGFKALNELYNKMEFKPGNETEAWGHLMQLVSNKLQSQTKKVFYFSDGQVRSKDTDLQTYSTPYFNLFDTMGIKYALVEGMSHDWVFHPEFDKLLYQPLDLFQDQSNITNKYDLRMIRQRKSAFVEMLKSKTDVEGFEGGFEFIDMPGLKLSMIVHSKDIDLIKQSYLQLYNRQIKNAKDGSVAKTKMENFKELVEQADRFDGTIQQAVKELILESMVRGKNKDLYIEALEWTPEQINKFYVGRQTMFNTMKFKRIDPKLLKAQVISYDTMTQLAGKSIDIDGVLSARKFLTKKGYGLAVFDDSLDSFDLKIQFEKQNPGKKWETYYGDRKTESNVDSITFISKEMADFLAFHYGTPGKKVFKPIISSQGEGNLMYGKTAFVYDSKLDGFFKSNPELDILMAASADKLKLYQGKDINNVASEMLQIPKESLYTTGAINRSKIIKLPLESIGIQKIPDHYTAAKISPSVINNHTDLNVAKEIYNDYYSVDLARNVDRITEMLKNPFIEHELMRQLKSGQSSTKLEDMELMDGAGVNMGMHLEWLNISEYASIDVFGSNAKMNPIKSKFIDSVMAPKSEYYDTNGIQRRYGAKSVIAQHAGIDLQGTLFNPETGKIERYGEMLLPNDIGSETIDFVGKNFDVRVINSKTNEIFTAKEIYEKFSTYSNLKWDQIVKSSEPLKTLFNIFERGALKDYDIGIQVMRYPRTRPNDLTYLRLKGFVDAKSGNTAIVNSYDVYNIFEGDYDIDAVDYFWGGSKAFSDNIIRQQKVFVPTADVSNATEILPAIEFSPKNPNGTNQQWQTLNSNQRALSGIRGVVQATGALTKHLDNIAEKTPSSNLYPNGRKILLKNPNVKENQAGYWEVEMDWDNADFHLRQALEGQILLDATSPDSNMLNNVRQWRYEFLFPEFSSGKTLSRDDLYSINPKTKERVYDTRNLRKFIDGKKTQTNEFSDYRVRLFRRYEWVMENGELVRQEKDLRTIDKRHLTAIMRQYSQLLEVTPGRKVHTAGNSKSASYDDMLFRSQKYFTYAGNFQDVIFKNLFYSQQVDPINGGTAYTFQQKATDLNTKDFNEYYNPKLNSWYDSKGNQKFAKYKKHATTSPFARGVIENMQKVSNGEIGGVVERMLYKIQSEDPLNALHSDTRVLTNESYVREMKLVNELLNNESFDVSEMNNFIPRLIGQVKHDVGVIKRLKFQAAMVNKSRAKNKKARLKELNFEIKGLQDKLKPLLETEYNKYSKSKPVKFDMVDIQNDRNVIGGTVAYYTLDHLNKYAQVQNPGKLKTDLKEHRMFIGKNYGNLIELNGLGYKRRSIYTEDIQKSISDVKTSKDIEMTSEQMLTKGVVEHGLSYLWSFAMPKVTSIQNKIGVFNGNVMPVAIEASGNYARAIKWLLKGHAGLLPKEIYKNTPKQNFTSMLKSLAEVDFVWRRFFSGTSKHLPMDAVEVNKMLTYGAPKWHWKMNSLFSNYTDIKIDKPIDEFNPFGMGRKYDMNVAFFRSLANVDRAINGKEFDKGASILSYTNQLMMENGYMLPQKHLALLSDASKQLGPVMGKVFPNQIDINNGSVQPLKPFDMLNNPMYVLLGGGTGVQGSGLSLDPWKAMNSYEQNSVNKMMKQVKDMKNTERDYLKEAYFETDIRQDVTKKPGDC